MHVRSFGVLFLFLYHVNFGRTLVRPNVLTALEHVHHHQGYSLLEEAKIPMQVWEYMLDPILYAMARKLVKNGKRHLTGYLPNNVSFRMAIGMVNPLRIDDIWDRNALAYNPGLSKTHHSEKILGRAAVRKAHRGQVASQVHQTVGGCLGGGRLCLG